MKNTLNEQSVTVGNTTASLVEENGVVTVKVQSEDAVVYMNDEMIWSIGNEKEELKRVPKVLHGFLIEEGDDCIEFSEKTNETVVDTYVSGECLTFYIPTNQQKDILGRFDLITSISEVEDYLLSVEEEESIKLVLKELEARFRNLRSLIEEKGYRMVFSHSMGEWAYAWWDIVFKAKDFHEGSIREIMKEVDAFNSFIRKIRDSYGF